MTCREALDFLSDYLTGELPAETRGLFALHLEACESCVAYLDSYRATIALARAARTEAGSEELADVPEPLVRAILAARDARSH